MSMMVNFSAAALGTVLAATSPAWGQSPFAATVIDFSPAPGQFVNYSAFNDPAETLGPPTGGGTDAQDNSSLVSLGGFGGSITLAFDHTVMDQAANPRGLDAIVFGNAFWYGGNPNRRWAECGHLEISRDVNSNGQADDPWYLIPGSHLTDWPGQFETQTWDDDVGDPTYPPANPNWIPPGRTGTWTTSGYRLPAAVFERDPPVVENPNGLDATLEGIFGYADYSPTLLLGDLDGDNLVDDPTMSPEDFYTVPDDPFEVGITPASGGGDAFDVAWAIDPLTGAPAGLEGFDYIRITCAVNYLTQYLGELSTEIDAVADVGPGPMGDGDWDGDVDNDDLAVFVDCTTGPGTPLGPPGCRVMDFDGDDDVDLGDFAAWQLAFAVP